MGRLPDRIALGLVLLVAIAYGAVDLFNLDLGLARATGHYIVEAGVPHTNVFSSVHTDRPFVDDKWLFHWLTYVAVDGIGPWFAVSLRMVLLVLLGWALAVPLRSRAPGRAENDATGDRPSMSAIAALLAAVALVAASERFRFRPELFTLLFGAVFARILLRPEAPSRKELGGLVGMQILWTSLHGYFVLGPILAGAAAIGLAIDAVFKRSSFGESIRRLSLAPLLFAVGIINPYGWKLLHSPVRILLDLKGSKEFYSGAIEEFAPTFAYFPVLPTDLLAYRVLLGLVAIALAARIFRARFVQIVPVIVVFAMSLDIRRNISVFAVVAAPIAADWIAEAIRTWVRKPGGRQLLGDGVALVAGALCVGIVIGLGTGRFSERDRLDREAGFGLTSAAWPSAEVDFVLDELPADGLFNSFSFGSYLVGRSWPERLVFIDGNTSGYDVTFFQEYADFVNGRIPDIDEFVARYGLRSFLIKPGHAVTQMLLAREDTVPLFLGRHAVVIGLRGRVPDDVLDRFDLRAAIDRRESLSESSRVSTALRRVTPVAEMTQAHFLRALGRFPEAIRACDAAAKVNDRWFEPWLLRGQLLLDLQQAGAARRSFDEALERTPGLASALGWRGFAWVQLQKFDAAAADLDASLEIDPSNSRVWFRRALSAQGSGDLPGAARFVKEAVDREPSFGTGWILLARLRGLAGDRSGAAAALDKAEACSLRESERGIVSQLRAGLSGP